MTRDEYVLWGAKAMAVRGERLPQTKLTVDAVRAIKANVRGMTARQLADLHDVHFRTIEKIRSGETWGHVGKTKPAAVTAGL